MKSAANHATIMPVQGHHHLLIELKLCNEIIRIGGKTGAWENFGRLTRSQLEPRLLVRINSSVPSLTVIACRFDMHVEN